MKLSRMLILLLISAMLLNGTVLAEKPDPGNASALVNAGLASFRQGSVTEAVHYLDDAIRIEPENEAAWIAKGTIFISQKQYDAALEAFDKVLGIDPANAVVIQARNETLKNLESVKSTVQDDKSAGERVQAGIVSARKKNYSEAIAAFEEALKINPENATVWVYKAEVLDRMGEHQEALAAADKAVETDPLDEGTWIAQGTALDNLGRYGKASDSFDRALDINPENVVAWCNKGIALSHDLDFPDAYHAFSQALKIDPGYEDAITGRKYAERKAVEFGLEEYLQ
jgi:tetratricopeptide (TPR) repeat protein